MALVGLLRRPDLDLARVMDVAAAEAAALLDRPIAPRLVLATGCRRRTLDHGTGTAPLGAFAWSRAHRYRQVYSPGRLDAELRRHALLPPGTAAAIVTDVELEPPPGWRYLVFRSSRRGGIVSLAPLDPRFWGDHDPRRLRRLKARLRAALVAALAPALDLPRCAEPGCFFERGVDGVDALDAMETVGPRHGSHPGRGHHFVAARRALDLDALRPLPVPVRRHPRAFERRPDRPVAVAAHWLAGPRAVLELFRARRVAPGRVACERHHATPWAATVRPPVEEVEFDDDALAPVLAALERVVTGAGRGINVPRPPAADPAAAAAELRRAGSRLYDLFFPPALERALPRRSVFLELGIDEALAHLPFELMHDGHGFLALKHFVGRFLNASVRRPEAHPSPLDRRERRGAPLRALVVAAGRARHAPGQPLDQAEPEAAAAVDSLAGLGARTRALLGAAAQVDAVYQALRGGPHLLHFSGHATLATAQQPSRLLLADGDLDAETLARLVARRPPAVVLLNACEAGQPPRFAPGRGQGLVDALLLAGSYVVAARWPVSDRAAASFAGAFYRALLEEGRSLGEAVAGGRRAARAAAAADDLTWAAYVLFGDPKLALRPPPA